MSLGIGVYGIRLISVYEIQEVSAECILSRGHNHHQFREAILQMIHPVASCSYKHLTKQSDTKKVKLPCESM